MAVLRRTSEPAFVRGASLGAPSEGVACMRSAAPSHIGAWSVVMLFAIPAACGEPSDRSADMPADTTSATARAGDPDTTNAATRTSGSLELDTVARGLSTPWAMAFAPDGRIFVTERPGRVRVIRDGELEPEPWARVEVTHTGESGLMGIALSPNFETDGHVFVVGTFTGDDGNLSNHVLRYTDRAGSGQEPRVIVAAIPAARFHAGDALVVGPDGKLYIGTGDAREPASAQDRGSLAGKILRYELDGSVPADNPFPGSPVYALGVRNVQGLAWHPETGDLFASDHGPSGFPNERFRRNSDELNVIIRGGNYGWPEVAGRGGGAGFVQPLAEWSPAIAPGGLAFYTGDHRAWRGSTFVSGLRGQQLRRISLERSGGRGEWRVSGEEVLFEKQFGRLRVVAMGPDGYLYFATSNRDGRGSPALSDDRIFRLRP